VIPTHVFSLSEQGVLKHCSPKFFLHNRDFLMRAFPSGMRVTSSNLDPAFYWRQGIQMVALNWQRWDKGMMLNEGMFAGEEGWVLKPEGYRGTRGALAGKAEEGVKRKTLSLTVEVFAGQNIPLPVGDENAKRFHPYVKCELHVEKSERMQSFDGQGESRESKKDKDEKFKKRSKTSKGIDPDFFAERLHFEDMNGVVEELSFLR
jgi:phosphatidylinositol phospholipase C, delta